MKLFSKKHLSNLQSFLTGLLIVVVFALSTGHDLFHNHEAGVTDPHQCPVYQLLIVLASSCIVCVIPLLFGMRILSNAFIPTYVFHIKPACSIHFSRGPPSI